MHCQCCGSELPIDYHDSQITPLKVPSLLKKKLWKPSSLKPVNSWQRKLGPDVAHDFTWFTAEPVKEIINETVGVAKKKGGRKGMVMDLGEIQELLDTTSEELTEDKYFPTSSRWWGRRQKKLFQKQTDLRQCGGRVPLIQVCFWLLLWHGPSMIQALKRKQTVEEGLVPHRNIFRAMKRQKVRMYDVFAHSCTECACLPVHLPYLWDSKTTRPLLSLLSTKAGSLMIHIHLMNRSLFCTVHKLNLLCMCVSSCGNLITIWEEHTEWDVFILSSFQYLFLCRHKMSNIYYKMNTALVSLTFYNLAFKLRYCAVCIPPSLSHNLRNWVPACHHRW